jgi:hypothetical protein
VKRRALLLSGLGALLAGVGLRVGLSHKESAIARMIYRRLDYLDLDPEGVAQFSRDVFAHGAVSGTKLRLIAAIGPLYDLLDRQNGTHPSSTILKGEERIVGEFLLSTDFFPNGADTHKLVRYVGYFDGPSDYHPCGNPFARRPETTAA